MGDFWIYGFFDFLISVPLLSGIQFASGAPVSESAFYLLAEGVEITIILLKISY